MGFKSAMKKVGKIGLMAAPYVAAPFTGGASLLATGLANKAVQKWSESDAKKAAAKGLAPSKFDSVLGKVGTVSSLASSFIPTNALGSIGMLGSAAKAANTASKVGKVASAANTASKVGGILKTAAKVAPGAIGAAGTINAMRGGGGADQYRTPDFNPAASSGSALGNAVARNSAGAVMPRGGYNYRNNPMNQLDQSNPNLSQSIFQGRQEAIKNQPFRKGYDVNYLGSDDETPYTVRMPPIYPNAKSQRKGGFKETAGIQGAPTTKRKKRAPVEEEEMAY